MGAANFQYKIILPEMCEGFLMSLITRDGFIWIPRNFTLNWKVEIVTSEATDDVTNNVINSECEKIATEGVGKFSLELEDNAGAYTTKYSGGEIVYFYWDLVDGTTKRFRGVIESVKRVYGSYGYTLKIEGSHIASKLLDVTVTKEYTNTTAYEILQDLVDTYATDFTYTNVETTGNAATVIDSIKWTHKSFWDAVIDLCNIAECDAYVDADMDFHFFASDSILNTEDAVVMDDNVLSVKGLGDEVSGVKNRIIVYGEDDQGVPIVYMDEDTTSQSALNIKEKIIKDTDIKTMDAAQKRATAELNFLKNTEFTGEAKTLLLPDLEPGEQVWFSIPKELIHDTYTVVKIKFNLGIDGFWSTTTVKRESGSLPILFKERIKDTMGVRGISNANEMRYSYNLTFDDETNISSHSNTAVDSGKLVLLSGQSSGTMTTIARMYPTTITSFEIRILGQDLNVSTLELSADNGTSYSDAKSLGSNIEEKIDIPSAQQGNLIMFKVNLMSDGANITPQIDSLCIMLK
jgi:hypothetical protein